MRPIIIDTNVLIVANRKAEHASLKCTLACIQALEGVCRTGIVVLDTGDAIFDEYRKYASLSGQPGVGDAFLKWLLTYKHTPERCRLVPITEDEQWGYVEFPHVDALQGFDRSDRKFVAVALAHERDYQCIPPIQNATDSDWWQYRHVFASHGIHIKFICDDQLQKWQQSEVET